MWLVVCRFNEEPQPPLVCDERLRQRGKGAPLPPETASQTIGRVWNLGQAQVDLVRARQEITVTINKVFPQANSGQSPGGTAEVDWLGLFVSFVSFCGIIRRQIPCIRL